MPIQMAIGAEEHFKGVVDLVKMKAILWSEEIMGPPSNTENSSLTCLKMGEMARNMMEAAAEATDELMEKYLEDGTLLRKISSAACVRTWRTK